MTGARLRLPLAVLTVIGVLLAVITAPAGATPANINGSGSTYVAIALNQWKADAATQGLRINYLPNGSPAGLTQFAQNLTDYAATEAEFSALEAGDPGRGYQYVPDVAGAVAIMYHVNDTAGRNVDYLHLSPRTIARIFMGDICNWSDPAITADNKGLVLPNQPINVVYRSGQSGTTGLFYDFNQHIAPDIFGPWAARNRYPTTVRIIDLDTSPGFACHTQALGSSDQIAQAVASGNGLWSISYDEFGYAKIYHDAVAWVSNGSGNWVLPYAENISAALESATLHPDLSQDLTNVYTTANPIAYPISAYSYLVTQCEPTPDRATCHGGYANPGITETLSRWLRYIACDGQVHMAEIGYSPLPPNLSQEVANSIARMEGHGTAPEQLTPANCSNPRFHGSLGAGASSPADPLRNVAKIGGGAAAATSAASDAAGAVAESSDAGVVGKGRAAIRTAAPVAYTRPALPASGILPLIVLLLVIAVPPIVLGVRRYRRRTRAAAT
jgi:phosphate transport system substrate-binding protein